MFLITCNITLKTRLYHNFSLLKFPNLLVTMQLYAELKVLRANCFQPSAEYFIVNNTYFRVKTYQSAAWNI